MPDLLWPVVAIAVVALLLGISIGYLIAHVRGAEARQMLQTHAYLRSQGILKMPRKSMMQGTPYRIEYALGSLKDPNGQIIVLVVDAPGEQVRWFFLEVYLSEKERFELVRKLSANEVTSVIFDGERLRIV